VSGQDDDFGSANSPVVQAYENSAQAQFDHESVAEAPESESANTHLPSEPAVQSAEIDFAPAAEVSAQAPAAAVTAVVTDEMPSIAPSATQAAAASNGKGAVSTEGAEPSAAATVSSASASGEERAPAEQPLSAASSAAERERQPQIPGSPSSPSFEPEVAASYSVEGVAGPSSGKPEPSTAVSAPSSLAADRPEGVPATVGSEAAEAAAPFDTAETESPSERAELDVADEDGEVEEEMEEEDFAEGPDEELTEDSETEPSAEGESDRELPTGVAAGAEGESETVTGSAGAGSSAESGAPGDRSYTLREPHQRPRFAPRRRRGRRVPGGAPRRFDRPRESSRPGNHHPVQIAEVLKEGQEILVQIAKEPLGTKGARITSHVALPGRYLVYMPTIEHIGVSRKIVSEEERLRLRNIILENKGSLTGGFIVRTAGQGRSDEEFKADLKFLSTLWADIRAKADRLKAPALLHRDLDLVQRLLRDLLTPDFKSVRVDNEIDYERVLDFVNRCQPGLIGKVKLYSRDTPLYEEFGIQQEIEKALKPKVWLKSGGYIVINQTEALVAIDVNTGKYVGKTNRLEDTIVKTNVDAVNEIVRQVRLRDLGGIIVIDFIDMDERKNRAKVVQALEEALRSDRAPTKVISFNDFGLVAVTRKRVKQSLERALCQPCDYCSGSGWVKSVNTVCNEILAEARKMANEIDGNVITLRVNPEVAKALKSREGGLLSELESMVKKDVIIKSDPSVHQERFEIY
jgi:ribonuclease G